MSQRTEKKIGKRSQATGAKRQLILTAALAVFSQYGIHGARLEQVAERAGVSKTNLLYYYPSKEALYVAVMRQILDVWLAPLKAFQGVSRRIFPSGGHQRVYPSQAGGFA